MQNVIYGSPKELQMNSSMLASGTPPPGAVARAVQAGVFELLARGQTGDLLAVDRRKAAANAMSLIAARSYRFQTETDLQRLVALTLNDAGVSFKRAPGPVTQAKPDLLIGDIAVKIKIAGTREEAIRQLTRYAQMDNVGALLVVSSCPWAFQLPQHLLNKPVWGMRVRQPLMV